jgi:hypothetical protein
MQPIHPEVREELKRLYPGLTDADIDRYDALTSRRFMLDPERSAGEIRRIDAERMEIVRGKMPELGAIENAFIIRRSEAAKRAETPPTIELPGRPRKAP